MEKTIIKMFPKIEFNMEKCIGGLDCAKCLQACPVNVLRTYTEKREGDARTSKDWLIVDTFPSMCTGCLKCVTVCPNAKEGAIKIEFVPMRIPVKG